MPIDYLSVYMQTYTTSSPAISFTYEVTRPEPSSYEVRPTCGLPLFSQRRRVDWQQVVTFSTQVSLGPTSSTSISTAITNALTAQAARSSGSYSFDVGTVFDDAVKCGQTSCSVKGSYSHKLSGTVHTDGYAVNGLFDRLT